MDCSASRTAGLTGGVSRGRGSGLRATDCEGEAKMLGSDMPAKPRCYDILSVCKGIVKCNLRVEVLVSAVQCFDTRKDGLPVDLIPRETTLQTASMDAKTGPLVG